MALLLSAVGVLGGLVGWALAGVIERVPAAAPLLARGRSRRQLPVALLTALLTATAFVLVTARALRIGQGAAVPALLAFTAVGIALSAIDLAVRRLPDVLVLPAYPALAVLLAGAAALRGDGASLVRAALGGLALFGFFLLLAAVHPPGMGFGDVKLAGVVGLLLGYLSWAALVVGTVAAFALGALVGLVVVARRGWRASLPFGPFLVAGGLIGLWVPGSLGGLAG